MKYLFRIIAVLITFAFGLLCSFFCDIWFTDLPQVKVIEKTSIAFPIVPLVVSLCELDSFPDKYDGKQIITEATVFANGYRENVLHPIDCFMTSSEIHFTFLQLKEFKKLQTALKNDKPYYKEVDVRVTGTVKTIYDKHVGKSYLIIPDSIEIISPFRKFTAKAAA